MMKKFRNAPENYQNEVMRGFALANRRLLRLPEGTRELQRRVPKQKGLVKLVMGNGGGHEPGWIGFIGQGLFDMDVLGDVFTAQSAKTLFKGIKNIDDGSPILLVISNHEGDVINGNQAYALCLDEDINIQKVLYYDDIASAPKGRENERRGMAGQLMSLKVTGAMAEEGASLGECVRVFEKSRDWTRTLVATLTSCTHPITGLKLLETPENEVEIGAGVHGERGLASTEFCTSHEIAGILCNRLIDDMPFKSGDEVVVIVNGMGSTTLGELSVVSQDVDSILTSTGISVYDMAAGNFVTTQEMGGISLSLCKVDDELKRLWDAPCSSPAFSRP